MRFTVSALVVCLSTPLSAEEPSFTGLGLPPWGDWDTTCEPTAVSADGLVVVGHCDAVTSGLPAAFRWENGNWAHLGDFSEAYATSADGRYTVGFLPSLGAVRWDGTTPTSIGPGRAHGVSADGSVVVGQFTNIDGHYEAFRWTQAGGMVGLGGLGFMSGDFISIAHDVSADGAVVVGGAVSESGSEAFRWVGGAMNGLGDLPGGSYYSTALAVSADGSTAVGWSYSANGEEAFRWTQPTGIVGLGDLPGGDFRSKALATSADGWFVVGQGFVQTGVNVRQPFIWDPDNGMQNLIELMTDEYGLDLTGWQLAVAAGVSEDGWTIVGGGGSPTMWEEAWKAYVPQARLIPTMTSWGMIVLALLLAAAGVIVFRTRRASAVR
jgi:probable HAF family extracellular repeat protein